MKRCSASSFSAFGTQPYEFWAGPTVTVAASAKETVVYRSVEKALFTGATRSISSEVLQYLFHWRCRGALPCSWQEIFIKLWAGPIPLKLRERDDLSVEKALFNLLALPVA